MNLPQALTMLPGLVIGITVHEFAHAWSASLLGDNFPRRQGRVSLNPLRHLSPLGTLAILLLPFGWGRPVEINLYNFKHPKRDYLITSLAGPLANVAVAIVGTGLMFLTCHPYRFGPHAQVWVNLSYLMLTVIVIINVMLAVLNLIPIPPLDGSKIWPCLIPGAKPTMRPKATGTFVIIFIILMSTHTLDGVIGSATKGVLGLLPQSDERVFAIRMERGESAYEQRNFPEAQKAFTEALAVNPRSDSCYYWLACSRGNQDDWAGALEDMNRAIELNPAEADHREYRAKLLTYFGRKEDAKADRAAAVKIRKSAAASKGPASRPTAPPD